MSTQEQVLGGPTSSLNLQNATGIKDPQVAAAASRQLMRKHIPAANDGDHWHLAMTESLYQFQSQQPAAQDRNADLHYEVA